LKNKVVEVLILEMSNSVSQVLFFFSLMTFHIVRHVRINI